MGRHPIFDQPMTSAERQARSRRMWQARLVSNPEHFAAMVGYELNKLDTYDVEVVAADKALALIARDIAKRRKALAPKLAEHRCERRRLALSQRAFGAMLGSHPTPSSATKTRAIARPSTSG